MSVTTVPYCCSCMKQEFVCVTGSSKKFHDTPQWHHLGRRLIWLILLKCRALIHKHRPTQFAVCQKKSMIVILLEGHQVPSSLVCVNQGLSILYHVITQTVRATWVSLLFQCCHWRAWSKSRLARIFNQVSINQQVLLTEANSFRLCSEGLLYLFVWLLFLFIYMLRYRTFDKNKSYYQLNGHVWTFGHYTDLKILL